MIFKLATQTVIAMTLLQVFPYNGGIIEQNAALSAEEIGFAPALYETLSLIDHKLPEAKDIDRKPVKVEVASMGVVTTAVSAVVIDRKTNSVLFEKNSTSPRSIGSITKLMTAYVFLQGSPDLNAPAMIETDDVRYGGIQHVKVADEITVEDMLYASLIGSDNSATAALARMSGMSLSDFVARMNETASEIGMTSTTFVDTTGLSSENRSTVYDIVKLLDTTLSNKIIQNATQLSVKDFVGASGRNYHIESTNELLTSFLNQNNYQLVGGKTGYLPEAGYCFGVIFSEDNGHEVVVVVLGSETKADRFQDAKSLASWAYKAYRWPDEL